MGGELSLLERIDCNVASLFAASCGFSPTLIFAETRELTLSFDAFEPRNQITAPPDATDAELVLLVFAIDPATGNETEAELFRVALPLQEGMVPAHAFTTAPLPAAQLVFVASAVFYYRKNNLAGRIVLNSTQCHPCEISAVLRS